MINTIKNKFKDYFFEEAEAQEVSGALNTTKNENHGATEASNTKKNKKGQALRDRMKSAIASSNPKRENESRTYMKGNKTFDESEKEQQVNLAELRSSYSKPAPSENREQLKNSVKSAIACANPENFPQKENEWDGAGNWDSENIQVEITTEELRSLEILPHANPKHANHHEDDAPIPSISLSLSSVNLFVDATDITAKSLNSAMELLEENNYTVEYGEIFTKIKSSILPNDESTEMWTTRMGKHNIYDYPNLDEEAIRKNMIGRLFETMHALSEAEKKDTIIGIISNHRRTWGEVLAYGKKEHIRIIFLSDEDSEDSEDSGNNADGSVDTADTAPNESKESSVDAVKPLDGELETEFEVMANEDFYHVESMVKTFGEKFDGGQNKESGEQTNSNANEKIQVTDEENVDDAIEGTEEDTEANEDNDSVSTKPIVDEEINDDQTREEAKTETSEEKVSLTEYEKFCIPEHYHDYFVENGYHGEILKLEFKDMTYAIPFFSGIREEVVLKILSNLSKFKLDYLQKNITEKYWGKYHILIKDGFLSVPMEEREENNRWLVQKGDMMSRILASCDIYIIDYFIRPRTGKQKVMPVEWSYHTDGDIEKVAMIPFFQGISKSMLIKAVSMETGMEENFLKESLATYLEKNHMFLKGISIYPKDGLNLKAKEA